uniref:Zinc finger, CCHC-type n=1 Tax=Tanacetum cinerariifolium TaxID=118510 RepID=A0A6L2K633_TANCI|nr:zinc finger, CCHC-type [Tanacetum cinerariifolium]
MQIILEANGLWETIEPNEKTQADNRKDKTAIAFFYQALPEDQLLQITKYKTAKAIWDALKTRHLGEERVQQTRLQNTQIRVLANSRLTTYEERIKYKKGKQVDHQERLMFTRHDNRGKHFRGRGRGKHRFSHDKNHENFKERENYYKSYNENNFKKPNHDNSKIRCYKSKKIGHIAPKCPQRRNPNEQSNLVEEDLEPTLLMTTLEEEEYDKVSLHQEDVGYKETNMDSLWYLDNGASNHMTGIREYFKELDEKVGGKVRFGDGSYIEIKGKDDYSRYMCAYFLTTKDQAFDTLKEFKKSIENELRTTSKMLRMDRGGEFTSNELMQYCKENGIARQLTAPYSPQQNRVVKRRNRTMMSTTRCMMKVTNMPQNFWAEAIRHAIHILNSVPTKALEDITPYEAIKRIKPNLANLKVLSCIAYAKVPSQHLTKLDDRSTKMFKEDETWDWKDYISEHTDDEPEWSDFRIENLDGADEHHDQEIPPIKKDNEFPYNDDDDFYASPIRNSPTHSQPLHIPTTHSLEANSQVIPNITTQSFSQSDNDTIQTTNTPSHFDHTPVRGFRTINDLYENIEELLLAEDEPRNYKEPSNDQKRIEAMKAELDSIN